VPASLRDLEPQAVGAIYDQYFTEIFRYVRYRLNDVRLAEDIAGDVFVGLLEAIQAGRGPQINIRAWLLSTASHMVTDHLRRAYRRPTESIQDEIADPAPTPVDVSEGREQSGEFQLAYDQLTHEQQHVLALRFGEGYSLEETAAVLKKKVNAVKALQFRALAALQRNLGKGQRE
jgi:RNA polymerase sigma-70 factor (ECF subfamily)